MSNFKEIRNVRSQMSAQAGHDVRQLIDAINQQYGSCSDRVLDLNKKTKPSSSSRLPIDPLSGDQSSVNAQ